jgi:hypothetical protein
MQELTNQDIDLVSGGADREHDIVPEAKSEWGNLVNDVSNTLGKLGGWIGRSIYDATHRTL